MSKRIERLEKLLEAGGIKKDIVLLIISGGALLVSILDAVPLPFDACLLYTSSEYPPHRHHR